MDKVLLVDDNPEFLKTLQNGLSLYVGQFEILTAKGSAEAIEILKKKKISLVATELLMPEMDGIQLLAHMTRHHSSIPCIVMTRNGEFSFSQKTPQRGLIRFIDKTSSIKELAASIIEGLDFLDEGANLEGMAVNNILPFIQMARTTGMIHIRHPHDDWGILYFEDGILLDACYGGMEPEEAALEIIKWKKVAISILRTPHDGGEKRIKSSHCFILDRFPEYTGTRFALESEIPEEFIEAPQGHEIIIEDPDADTEIAHVVLVEEIPAGKEQLSQKLEVFREVKGFLGIGVYSLGGDLLASLSTQPDLSFHCAGDSFCDAILKARQAVRSMSEGYFQAMEMTTESGLRICIRHVYENPMEVISVVAVTPDADMKAVELALKNCLSDLPDDLIT